MQQERSAQAAPGSGPLPVFGGAEGIRTPDPLLAKQVLSRLSYGPTLIAMLNVAVA